MYNNKISVIIPIYNSEKHLDKCIESIIKQSYSNLEIILINDGSVDNSLEICHKYASVDKRIVIIDKKNGGVASARNSGIEVSTGDYIGFVDSDDYISLEMYEKLIRAAYRDDADIVECGYYRVSSNNKKVESYPLKEEKISGNYNCSKKYLEGYNTTNFNVNKLYRKEIFNEVRYLDLKYSEDYLMNIMGHYYCNKKVIIKDCCYYYYDNIDSACNSDFTRSRLDIIKAGEEAIKFYEGKLSELNKYIYIYIINNIRKLYELLHRSSTNRKKEYTKFLLKKFRKNYSYVKRDLCKIVKPKTYFAFALFYISPKCYYIINRVRENRKGL